MKYLMMAVTLAAATLGQTAQAQQQLVYSKAGYAPTKAENVVAYTVNGEIHHMASEQGTGYAKTGGYAPAYSKTQVTYAAPVAAPFYAPAPAPVVHQVAAPVQHVQTTKPVVYEAAVIPVVSNVLEATSTHSQTEQPATYLPIIPTQ